MRLPRGRDARYFDPKYDIFANQIWFVNCSGSQSFEAIPD